MQFLAILPLFSQCGYWHNSFYLIFKSDTNTQVQIIPEMPTSFKKYLHLANGFKCTMLSVTMQITALAMLGKNWWDLHILLAVVPLKISALGTYFSLQTVFCWRTESLLEGDQAGNSEDWHDYFQWCIKENRDFNRNAQTLLLSHPTYNAWR